MQRLVAADGRATLTLLARNLQRLEWAERVSISPGDARSVLAASRVLSKGEPYAILVIMTSIVDLPPDARAVFNAEPLVVGAALLGRGPMDEVLAAGACRAVHPTRFFLSESSAREWLELSLAARSAQGNAEPR